MVTVRLTVADAPAMGRLHVRPGRPPTAARCRRLPRTARVAAERAAHWEYAVARGPPRRPPGGRAGRGGHRAAVIGPSRDPEGAGELYVIPDPDHRGTGAGRALLEAAQTELGRPADEWVLWVLSANARARRFHEVAGWAADGTERASEVFRPRCTRSATAGARAARRARRRRRSGPSSRSRRGSRRSGRARPRG